MEDPEELLVADSAYGVSSSINRDSYAGHVCHDWQVTRTNSSHESIIGWRRPTQERLEIGRIVARTNPATGRVRIRYEVTTWWSFAFKTTETIAAFEAGQIVSLGVDRFNGSAEEMNQFLYEVQMVKSYLHNSKLCAPPILGSAVDLPWCSISCGILSISFGAATSSSFTAMCAGGTAGFGAPACLGFTRVLFGTSVLLVKEVCNEAMSCDERDAKGDDRDSRPNHSGSWSSPG